ncbi:uncharacterized protein PG986_011288 [Apiospora aurea]|uniref:Rhodopsin domain-containing protein n=1 Tax=Apiospora aurea TaxID=335848 RepID=A0ABR1Q4P2_9PEZI
MCHVLNVQAGVEPYDEAQFLHRMRRWLVASLVAMLCFYTSLASVKLAFLFFFRRLGAGVQYFDRIWWAVLVVSVGSYLVAVGNLRYRCLVGSDVESVLRECNEAPSVGFETATLKANCALDVLTDFMVMSLPAILLWKAQIRWAKKLAILGLFSLSIVTTAIAIVRVANIDSTRRPDGNLDSSYLFLWTFIEPCVDFQVIEK